MPVARSSINTSPALGPSRSRVTTSSGLPAANAIAALVFMARTSFENARGPHGASKCADPKCADLADLMMAAERGQSASRFTHPGSALPDEQRADVAVVEVVGHAAAGGLARRRQRRPPLLALLGREAEADMHQLPQ